MNIATSVQKLLDKNTFESGEGDFDKWAIEQRVKESNRKWFFNRVFKFIIAVLIIVFMSKTINGG